MIQTLAKVVENSTAAKIATTIAVAAMGDDVKKEVATTGEDVKKVATKVDTIGEEVSATKKLVEKTNSRVEGAMQEHAKKIQQMVEELANIDAGAGSAERITRRGKTMENEVGGHERGRWSPSLTSLNGWVDLDQKMETMMDSVAARKLVEGIIMSLPTHRRAVIDEEVTYSDLSERVHQLKILIRIKPGCDERGVWPIRNRILEMHRTGMLGWPEKLKVQFEMNPRKKPKVTEMGKLLRWLKK